MQVADFQQVLASPVLAYEEGLNFFEGKGMLNETLSKLVDDLERHGYQRFTSDIDLLLTKEGLEIFQRELVGMGYRPAFEGARKKFRATARNVPIEIITAGEYPGDGKPKPISFPEPSESYLTINGVKTVTLELLITLKLASGLTAPGRLKDLADVQELIKLKQLTADFADELHPFVREKFLELQRDAHASQASTELDF
jgi:hypothetical protein